MNIIRIGIVLVLLGAPALADGPARGTSAEEMEALRVELARHGEAWLATGQEDRVVAAALDSVWYTPESRLVLGVALGAQYDDPEIELYVTEALLRPLRYATSDTIVALLPTVQQQVERVGAYTTDLPVWSDSEMALMRLAQTPVEEAEPPRQQQRRERGQVLLAERDEAVRRIQLHNEKVRDLRRLYVRILMLANTEQADQEAMTLLAQAQQQGARDYFDILSAIRFEAEYMTQERAAFFYDGLLALWQVGNMAQQSYVNYEQVLETADGELVFAETSARPGQALLRSLNHLASYARRPALEVR
jgi:hypothetical protein